MEYQKSEPGGLLSGHGDESRSQVASRGLAYGVCVRARPAWITNANCVRNRSSPG